MTDDNILEQFSAFVDQHQDHAYPISEQPGLERLMVLCCGLAGECGEVMDNGWDGGGVAGKWERFE